MKASVRIAMAAALFAFVAVVDVPLASQQPAPAQPPPAAASAPALPARRRPARRRAVAAAAAAGATRWSALYTERCAACHGTETAAGRAPNLFDDQWARAKDDEGIARVIADGVPQTEMIPFKGQLTDQQIWQLVAYLKTAGRQRQAAADLRRRSATGRRSRPRSRRSGSKSSRATSRRRGAWRSCPTAACSSPSAPASCGSSRRTSRAPS